MVKATVRISFSLLFLFAFFPYTVSAQIAPTNSATISGSVSDSSGKPVAHATVSLSGPKSTTTQTDAQGLFVFVGMPFGNYQISAAAAGLGTAVRSISVQGDTNVAIQYEPTSQNGLKVIAQVSSVANAQFNVTPASITQVNPIANAFEGKTSWRTILEQIPGVAQAGLQNGYTPIASLPDSPQAAVQISIDGALPYETAVLLDDMPLIGGAFFSVPGSGTDLGLYPLNGFGSADVVRGPGANAPSIVDSIGGSFVLHAPSAVTIDRYDLSISTDPYGGIVTNAQAAVRMRKLSIVATYGVNDSPGPLNAAVIPSQTDLPALVGGNTFQPYAPPCNSPCQYGGYLINPNYATNGFALYGQLTGLLTCCVNASTSWSQHSGSLALQYNLSPSLRIETFYAGQESHLAATFQNCTMLFTPPGIYAGSLLAGQYYLPNTAQTTSPINFPTASSLIEEKVTAQIGSGLLRLAALQNRTFFGDSGAHPASATLQLFGAGCLGSASPTTACPSGGTLTAFNGGTYNLTYPFGSSASNSSWTNNRDLSLEYAISLGKQLHGGVSFVQSYYDMPSNHALVYTFGLSSNTVFPSAVSQTTREFRVFIGGNPSEKTSLDLSAYFVNAGYHLQNPNDTTGNTYTDARYSYAAPRLGFVWRPTAAVAIRAAAGGGFAEAPLNDLVGTNGVSCPFASPVYYTQTLINVNLRPETAFSFDLGTDIRLQRGTMLSFDLYRSNLFGQIYQTTYATGTTYTGPYGTLPLFTSRYGNLGESRYEGILLDVRHNVPHGIYWALSGGLTRGYVASVPTGFYNNGSTCNLGTGSNCANVTVVPNVNFNGTFAASIPYSQGLGTLGYRWSGQKYLGLTATYYGNNNTYFRPAFVELDGQVGYPLSKVASLLITFRNITGIYDGAIQAFTSSSILGAPTVTGGPYPLYGEMYGPRTVLVTTRLSL